MKKLLHIFASSFLLTACGDSVHTCNCTDSVTKATIASYELQGKKESAAFECKQKGMQYSGPEYKDVQCKLDEK